MKRGEHYTSERDANARRKTWQFVACHKTAGISPQPYAKHSYWLYFLKCNSILLYIIKLRGSQELSEILITM